MKMKKILSVISVLIIASIFSACESEEGSTIKESEASQEIKSSINTTVAQVETAAATTASTAVSVSSADKDAELKLTGNVKVGEIGFLVSKKWTKSDDGHMWTASDHSNFSITEPSEIDEDELSEQDKETLESIFGDAKITDSIFSKKLKGLKTVEITAENAGMVFKYYGTVYNGKLYGFLVTDSKNGEKTIIGKAFDDIVNSMCFLGGTGRSETEDKTENPEEKVSREFSNALEQAKKYNKSLHMSKDGLFQQLTSEYGANFPEDAAQYAIDNLDADYKENALKSAEDYNKALHMSKDALFHQLISEHGAQFTEEEAQYAIGHIDIDYKENALKSARDYLDALHLSDSELYDQLVSDHGAQFTEEEAQYAIDHLD